MELLEILHDAGIEYVHKNPDGLCYKCPFCNDKKGHFDVVPSRNIWRCARCGEGGGVFAFLMKFYGLSYEETLKKLKENDANAQPQILPKKVLPVKESKTVAISSPEHRDGVYRYLLFLLNLSEKHHMDLLKRGMSEEHISLSLFRSVPSAADEPKIIKSLCERYNLSGIPGFYPDIDGWHMNLSHSGFFCPFINTDGLITSMQVRSDDPNAKLRYTAFSSVKWDGGCKASIEPHFIRRKGVSVLITEGSLKAEVASSLFEEIYGRNDISFLALPGVNGTKALKKALIELKKIGYTEIINCFDMDRVGNLTVEKNKNVSDAVRKASVICMNEGFRWIDLQWKHEKGIDDYLLTLKKDA